MHRQPLIPLDSREQAYCIFARSPLSLSARLPAHSSNCCDLVHDSGLQGWPHWIQVGCVAVASDRERELEVLVLLVHILLSAPSIPMAPAPTHARLAPSKMRSCHRLGLHLLALQPTVLLVGASLFTLAHVGRCIVKRLRRPHPLDELSSCDRKPEETGLSAGSVAPPPPPLSPQAPATTLDAEEGGCMQAAPVLEAAPA
eukprot:1134413-Pelagomonas_calceolata.AAC.1